MYKAKKIKIIDAMNSDYKIINYTEEDYEDEYKYEYEEIK